MGLEVEVVGESNKFDVIVIGGGMAGMIASSVVTQAGLKACFLEKEVPGGKLMFIDKIHNFSNYSEINGKDLALSIFKKVTEEIKTVYIYGDVQSMKVNNNKFFLFTKDGQIWECKAIIIATGTIIKKLTVPGEDDFFNHGLSYCVSCDAILSKNKKVVLIGSVVHLDILKKYAKEVIVLPANEVAKFVGTDCLKKIIKKDGMEVLCDFAFIENGFESILNFLLPEVKLTSLNEIIVDNKMASSYNGIYACGDCTNSSIKMLNSAMSQAVIAANSAIEYIKSKKW